MDTKPVNKCQQKATSVKFREDERLALGRYSYRNNCSIAKAVRLAVREYLKMGKSKDSQS